MQYLPIFTKLDNKPVVIIGGGEVAVRKARALLKANARLTLVAPSFDKAVYALQESFDITLIQATFDASQLHGAMLVIAATDDETVNQQVFNAADEMNIFVNVVDDQPKCSFIFPSIIDRNPITIAISSAGTAPVLARRLREKLETLVPQHIGPLAELVGRFRNTVKSRFSQLSDRRQFWEKVFDSVVVSDIQSGNTTDAETRLKSMLEAEPKPEGEVYIVGATLVMRNC